MNNDTDSDGLVDGAEINRFGTSPTHKDSNSDGLEDGAAVETGLTPSKEYSGEVGIALQEAYEISTTKGDGPPSFLVEHRRSRDELSGFEREQLLIWQNMSDRHKEAVITNDTIDPMPGHLFYLRDWDRDGYLNGNDPDPDDPADTDGDGILDRFYNHNMDTDFDPEVDKVGESGDRQGNGSLSGASPHRADYFIWYDWVEGTKLTAEARNRLAETFADAPKSNPDGSSGIQIHWMEGEEVSRPSRHNSAQRYETNVPDELKGVVNYVISVNELQEPAAGFGLDLRGGGEGAIFVSDGSRSRWQAHVIMHEFGHVVGPNGTTGNSSDRPFVHQTTGRTAMNTQKTYVAYEENEWRRFVEHIGVLTYHDSITEAVEPPRFALFSKEENAELNGPPVRQDVENVVLKNLGGEPLNITGWAVVDGEDRHTYVFTENVTIPPKGYVVLYMTNGTDTESEFYWEADEPIFADDDCSGQIIVRNARGELMSDFRWTDSNFGEGCSGD